MIVYAPQEILWAWLDTRLRVPWNDEFRAIGCVKHDCLVAVVAYTAWVGRTCVAHIAIDDPHGIDRTFVYEALAYPFLAGNCLYILSVSYESNARSVKQHTRLGFEEYGRLEAAAPDGSDMILMRLHRDKCGVVKNGIWRRISSGSTGLRGGCEAAGGELRADSCGPDSRQSSEYHHPVGDDVVDTYH